MILRRLKQFLIEKSRAEEGPDSLREKIERAVVHVNSAGFDEWGLDPEAIEATAKAAEWAYRNYFRVKTVGIENIPEGRVLLIGNHGGQFPIDGMLTSLALLMDGKPPRIARGMVERFFPLLPFIGTWFVRCGGMVGDSRNCRLLLEREECVLVFPEGVKGSGKTIHERYQLQDFGTGFMRLALESKAPIVPVAVIGCEETYPGLYNFKKVAKLFGLPYLPVTPFLPLLGPLGLIPLPTQVTLRFCKPMYFDADPNAPDNEIIALVDQVKEALQKEVNLGLEERGEKIFG